MIKNFLKTAAAIVFVSGGLLLAAPSHLIADTCSGGGATCECSGTCGANGNGCWCNPSPKV